MNKEQLENLNEMAGKSFDYTGENHPMGYNYIGDGAYDFGGRSAFNNFLAEYQATRTFSYRFENATDQIVNVAVSQAYFDTLARLTAEGKNVDAILDDGVIFTDGAGRTLTASSLDPRKSIFTFKSFFQRNPLRVVEAHIQSSNTEMFEQVVTIENMSPLNDIGTEKILLTTYKSSHQFAQDKIDMPLLSNGDVLDFNDQNLVIIPIPPGNTTINWKIGGIKNDALSLKVNATAAHLNIQKKGMTVCGR